MGNWFAHSHGRLAPEQWHLLRDHLLSVGTQAARSADKFGAAEMGLSAGLLHDLGKYSAAFQARLKGEGRRVDHSTAGAIVAIERYAAGKFPIGLLIAAAVAGHHAGLADGAGQGQRTPLEDRLTQTLGGELPALDPAWQTEIVLPERIRQPCFGSHPDRKIAEERGGFQAAFFTRMLFSCLVDADYLDTEAWFAKVDGVALSRGDWPELVQLQAALDRSLASKQQQARPGVVNDARAEVLAAARAAAEQPPGLFSLTVPTGGGKTLSGFAFAIDHAMRWQLDRVIYIAPFTSVIEQNAQAFRDALSPHHDVVLEHHSAFRDEEVLRERSHMPGEQGLEAGEKLKLAMENWDAPVIATTAVQFFESLFAATPSRCRKLHNIARSVVILDEAQTLPLPLLRPCIAAIDELARNYGTSVVLCTATQPAIEEHDDDPAHSFKGGLRDVRPIVAPTDRDRLFSVLSRVRIQKLDEELEDRALAEMLREREQVLCIVNSRGHARAIFEALRGERGARHLSTWMCAAHRASVLDEIRHDLAEGQPCRVVSTSLVEAGVDVDFPCVFRAEAGLDSVAQAAGRCNREGRRKIGESTVFVFKPVNWPAPPEVEQFAGAMREIMRHQRELLSPKAIEAYFRRVYWLKQAGREDDLDKKKIVGLLNEHVRDMLFPFESVEKAFRIIEDAEQPVIVYYQGEAREHIERLRHAERVGSLARKLQRYLVPVHPGIFARLLSTNAIAPAREDDAGRQFFALVNTDLYRDDVGLVWDDPCFIEAEKTIL